MFRYLLIPAIAFTGLSACQDGNEVAEASRTVATAALMNPNTASEADLAAVEGLDAELAGVIAANRPFPDGVAFVRLLEEYRDDETRDVVLGQVFLPLGLNSTAEADFQTIPGVGRKMAHEFEEYRPYESMEQWEREIGKYVDAEELARLRRYVVVD